MVGQLEHMIVNIRITITNILLLIIGGDITSYNIKRPIKLFVPNAHFLYLSPLKRGRKGA